MKKFFAVLITLCFITSSEVFAQNSNDFQTVSQNRVSVRYHHFGFWGPSFSHRSRWHHHSPFFYRHHFYSRPVVNVVNVTPPDPFQAERERERLERVREAQRNLALISVLNERFFRVFSSAAAPAAVAEVTVINNSDLAISEIFFRGRIETHITNRVIIDDVFNYELPRHLQPGERAVYRIPLSSFSRWANIRPPDMAVFTATVTGITTSSGEIIRSN